VLQVYFYWRLSVLPAWEKMGNANRNLPPKWESGGYVTTLYLMIIHELVPRLFLSRNYLGADAKIRLR